MTFNILVATDLTDEAMACLRGADDVNAKPVPPSFPAVRDAIRTAHALIVRDGIHVDGDLLDTAPALKVIARVGAGLNGVDMEAATQRGVIVMNTPGTSAIAHGELAVMLMLALSRKIVTAHQSLVDGEGVLDRRQQAGVQLYGKTLGAIGLGRVGQVVAQRCLAFGMTVLANDPYISEDQVGDERILLVGLRELLQRSDFVSIHLPLTAETRGLISAETIRLMKPGARLINIAHGDIWDENAVADAVKSGHLAGVAMDVYPEEPPYTSPLVGLDNVLHTPHIGDNTVEATQDLSMQIVEQVLDALRGLDYRNVVNMPFMPGVDYETVRPYLRLAMCIGQIFHSLAREPVRRVAIECRGDDVTGVIKPVAVGVLTGLLRPVLGDKVNTINAPVLAAERGIVVTQAKGLQAGEYTNLVSCRVTLEGGEQITISGMLLDRKQPYIVQINQYRMNFVPEGRLLIFGSFDKPGVIGRIGTLMATNNVNIGSWYTGRAELGGHTLTVLILDQPVSGTVLDELRQLEFVRHARQVEIKD